MGLAGRAGLYGSLTRTVVRDDRVSGVFAQGRGGLAGVLDRFLARPRLYQTDLFHDRLEGVARANLAAEAAALRIGSGADA